MKKRYITLIDRTFKGKEWWSSGYRGYQFVRSLTEEEASALENIQEAPPIIKPVFIKCVVYDKKLGRISCTCGSIKGFYVHKMHRGKQSGWYTTYKCADCGSREKRMI